MAHARDEGEASPAIDYHVIQVGPTDFIAVAVDPRGCLTGSVKEGVLSFQAGDDPAEKLRWRAEGDGIEVRDVIVHREDRRA